MPVGDPVTSSFEVLRVTTPVLREKAHRLRYEVYCRERRYEDPADHMAGREFDEFDEHSVQSILIHRRTGMAAGMVRLILPIHDGQRGTLPFHETFCPQAAGQPVSVPVLTTGEASRLLISRDLVGKSGYPAGQGRNNTCGDTTVLQDLLFGLIASLVQMSEPHNITHICALMRPALIRLLRRIGIHFQAHGPMIDHHGWRQPCFAVIDDVSASVALKRPALWRIMFVSGLLWQSSFDGQAA